MFLQFVLLPPFLGVGFGLGLEAGMHLKEEVIRDIVETELLKGGAEAFQKFRKQTAVALLQSSRVPRVAPAGSLEALCSLQPL